MNFKLADTFAGTYRVFGISAGKKNYAGFATITSHGLFGHVADVIDQTHPRDGLAVVRDERLLIAWGPKDKVEIGAYRITGDSMHGIWIPPTAAGVDLTICGHEWSVRVGDNGWRIAQAQGLGTK